MAPKPTVLARRLRDLREHVTATGRPLTQKEVAAALEVSHSLVCSWERSDRVPPTRRLAAYAQLFAVVGRSDLRPVDEAELTVEERGHRDRLASELIRLREEALGRQPVIGKLSTDTSSSRWRFPDGEPVRIICGALPEPPPEADPAHINHVRLSAFNDLDALVELLKHVQRRNPESDVDYKLAKEVDAADLQANLVLLGSWLTNPVAGVTQHLSALPIQQVRDAELEGEVFQSTDDLKREFRPCFKGSRDGVEYRPHDSAGFTDTKESPQSEDRGAAQHGLLEDVAMFARTPNPNNVKRTMTVCTGVFSRGVCAAVKILTDVVLSGTNEAELDRICGVTDSYGVLFRVPVYGTTTSIPDLRNQDLILHTWPQND